MSDVNSTVTKSSTDLYLIRCGYDGGSVVLRFGEKCVTVMAHTSFGTYGYFWSHTGPNPRQFLCDVGMDYAMEKLSGYSLYEPDPDKYEVEIKRSIIEARRNGRLKKYAARDAWCDLLGYLNDFGAGPAFAAIVASSEHFGTVFGDYDALPSGGRVRAQCRGFWDHIWKPLISHLTVELEHDNA